MSSLDSRSFHTQRSRGLGLLQTSREVRGMAQQPIELILLRQWASYLAMPLWIVDTNGDLLFYNEPAEAILGERFDEAGQINASDLAAMFRTTAPDGTALASNELPIVIALTEHRPAHAQIRFQSLDHEWRNIEVSAFPVQGQSGGNLGAVAMFWEIERP